jgi:S-DNA-T family DNA segregation ATPase FtsK/SpoIIIE
MLGRGQLRIVLWVLGWGAATATASALPATARWPLPTGLGGVTGDALLAAAKAITGLAHAPYSALLGFAFAGVAILSITAACGYGLSEDAHGAAPAGREDWDEAEENAGNDEPGWAIVSLGALAHGFMSLRAGVRRWVDSRARRILAVSRWRSAGRVGAGRARDPPHPQGAGLRSAAPGPQGRAHAGRGRGGRGLRFGSASPRAPEHPVRVAPLPPAPKPGRRIAREAQTSFLEESKYKLPALALLAEPKKPQTPTVSAEALEQNATLLEGTLDDFGVKGEIINVRPGPVVTLYELEPAPGTKSSRVISLRTTSPAP